MVSGRVRTSRATTRRVSSNEISFIRFSVLTRAVLRAGIQYALVGPKRLFASSVFKPVTYGFVCVKPPLRVMSIHSTDFDHVQGWCRCSVGDLAAAPALPASSVRSLVRVSVLKLGSNINESFCVRNCTIFFASAATFYGNLSTGPFTTFLLGTFTNFYLFRYRHAFWNK